MNRVHPPGEDKYTGGPEEAAAIMGALTRGYSPPPAPSQPQTVVIDGVEYEVTDSPEPPVIATGEGYTGG